jgi:hypothetical protein
MIDIQQTLKKIDNVDLKDENAIDIIHKIVSTEIKKLPIFLKDLNVGEYLVRSRYLTDKEDFHYKVQDYSYNPYPVHIKVGRANYVGQQIFYGSRFRVTSLGEVRFLYANREKDEARYSLGRWEVKENLKLAAIVTPELIRKHNAVELFDLANIIEELEEKCRYDPEMSSFIDIYRYMASKYTEAIIEGEEYKYKITAVFSNFIYSKLHPADGILYQSIQYPENFNVALTKEVVDQNKIQLTFAVRQKYLRTGHLSYKEGESIQATNINYDTGNLSW